MTPQLMIITIFDITILQNLIKLHLCTEMCHEDFASLSEEFSSIYEASKFKKQSVGKCK